MLAAEMYGITINVHSIDSEQIYEIEKDCPIVQLLKIRLNDTPYIYHATEQILIQTNNDVNEITHYEADRIDLSMNVCVRILKGV
jgi:hypothetical protein